MSEVRSSDKALIASQALREVERAVLWTALVYGGKRQSHPCNFCGHVFYRKYNLDVHMRIHTGERPFACKVCGKSFNRKSTLRGHMLTHMSNDAIF